MVQILPPNDDFALGSPSMGQFVCLYLGCVLSTSSVASWGSAFVARPIHAAYQTSDSQGVHDYNAAFHSSGATTRTPSAVMLRRGTAADYTVTGTFEMRALAGGAPGIADLAPRGVLARAQGGTLAGDGTADVRYTDASAYVAAAYQKASDSTLRLAILRFNAGTATVLTESVSLPTSTAQWTALATITLSVSGSGATVTLSATFTGLGSNATATINASDVSGSRLTNAGRAGFLMGPDRIVSGRTTVDLCHLFAVDDPTRTVQDEFRRLSLGASKQTSTDGAGTSGSGYLNSAFFWDAGTFDGTATASSKNYVGSKRLKTSSGQSSFDCQVTDDDLTSPVGRHAPAFLLLAQRPADNLFSQHRSIKITLPGSSIPSASTGEVWAGIILRASQAVAAIQSTGAADQAISSNPNSFAGTGYALVVRALTSTHVTWQLHRFVNNSHLFIAKRDENGSFSTFPGYGVQFTLDFDVHPRDTADPFGVVEIVCKVNGAALTFTAFQGGADTGVAGKVIDGSSSRVQAGAGEGFLTSNGLTSSGAAVNDYDPLFDDWTQGTLTNAVTLDQDLATIATQAEDSATGTALDTILGPDWPFEVQYVSHHVSSPFESGHRQTMPRFMNGAAPYRRARMKFQKRGVRSLELASLIAHWNAHDGQELGFSFTAPGDSARDMRYASPLKYSLIAPGLFEVSFDLDEQL